MRKTKLCMRSRRSGVMVAFLAIVLPALLILAAFAINLACMELARTELQIATDSATRAAGRRLALTGSASASINEGILAASKNSVGGTQLTLDAGNFEFGESNRSSVSSRYSFTPTTQQPNSVRITASHDLNLFFADLTSATTFRPVQVGVSTQIELDIAIVMDRSGSMAYSVNEATPTDIYYPPASAPPGWDYGQPAPPDCRWRDAVAAVEAFLAEVAWTPQDEHIAVVSYGDDATTALDFTTTHDDVTTALDAYTQAYPPGSTNIHAGIAEGAHALSTSTSTRPWASKVIIVLTDGIQTSGSDPVDAARAAAEQGITVYTVTFSSEAGQDEMRTVAEEGLGKHLHANTPADLVAAFEEIARQLPTLITH